MKISGNQLSEAVNQHTHAPDATKIEVTKIRADMKRRAETTNNAPQRILSDRLANASVAAAVNLPRIEHVRRTIRRYRVGGPAAPVAPQNRADVQVILNEFQSTSTGDRFLLCDSGIEDANRMIIFATVECLDLLKQSDHWFADGTFSVSPAIFFASTHSERYL